MKKIYSMIAMAAFALAANAEITTDVSGWKNYLYIDETTTTVEGYKTSLTAGKDDNVVLIALKQDGSAQSLGWTVVFPEGWTPVAGAAINDVYKFTTNALGKKTYAIAEQNYTIVDNTFKTGLQGGGAEGNYLSDGVVYAVIVKIPSTASSKADITVTEGEVSVTEAYRDANSFEYNYEKHDVTSSLTVSGGADAIETVAADGAEAAAPAKKVVDGQLVIETANGTFTAAGAQVK